MQKITISKSKRAVFDASLATLKKSGFLVTSDDYRRGLINAEKGMDILSYGHSITIEIQSAAPQKTIVKVSSNSIGIQIVDWGRNSENETAIIASLKKAIK